MQAVVRGNGCVFVVMLGSVAVVAGRLRVGGNVPASQPTNKQTNKKKQSKKETNEQKHQWSASIGISAMPNGLCGLIGLEQAQRQQYGKLIESHMEPTKQVSKMSQPGCVLKKRHDFSK